MRQFPETDQIGDGCEAACADYVVANARRGDIDDVLATIDKFAYEKSMLMNIGAKRLTQLAVDAFGDPLGLFGHETDERRSGHEADEAQTLCGGLVTLNERLALGV